MDKLKDKCCKELHIAGRKATTIIQTLMRTKSLETTADMARGCEDQDLDHLLEDDDQVGDS